MKNNIVLVTGGAGYVGSVLCEKLVEEGFKVRVFDQFYFGQKPLEHLASKVEILQGDIRKIPENLLEGVSSIIHLAALSNDPTAEFAPSANYDINTKATKILAQMAKRKGVRRFIFGSSCSIYDKGMANGDEIRDEEAKVAPSAPYSASKYLAEGELLRLADEGFCVVILRKGTVFGFSKRMRYDLVVNTMVKNALSGGIIKVFCRGAQWRPLVDIEDAAGAYLLALTGPAERLNRQIINIALDNFLVRDLASLVQSAIAENFSIKVKIVFEQDERRDRSYRVSNKKAKNLLNFTARATVVESAVKMVENIKKNGFGDFENPIYYNIDWMRPFLEEESKKF